MIASSLDLCPKVRGIDHPVIGSCVLQVPYFHIDVDVASSVFSYSCLCGMFSIFIPMLMWQVQFFHIDDMVGSIFLY